MEPKTLAQKAHEMPDEDDSNLRELTELAVQFFNHELSIKQVQYALGLKTQANMPTEINRRMASVLRRAIGRGFVVLHEGRCND